jgi:hypothetical protein
MVEGVNTVAAVVTVAATVGGYRRVASLIRQLAAGRKITIAYDKDRLDVTVEGPQDDAETEGAIEAALTEARPPVDG